MTKCEANWKIAGVLDVGSLREDLIRQRARFVAIDGRGGSGKSTLARQVVQRWPNAVIVEMDDFYRPSSERVLRSLVHGANWDRERLVAEVLEPLTAGRAARYQRYDWGEDRLAEWHEVPPATLRLRSRRRAQTSPSMAAAPQALVFGFESAPEVRNASGAPTDRRGG